MTDPPPPPKTALTGSVKEFAVPLPSGAIAAFKIPFPMSEDDFTHYELSALQTGHRQEVARRINNKKNRGFVTGDLAASGEDCPRTVRTPYSTINTNQAQMDKIIPLLSKDRFESYRKHGEDDDTALARLKWNIALCEALYPTLHWLEIGFRNRMHQCIGQYTAGENWILDPKFLSTSEQEEIAEAKRKLSGHGKPETVPHLIAELKFGFWTALADSRYDVMWHKIIRCVFPYLPNTNRNRVHVSKRLTRVRRLRNAAWHHHSIWHWHDLEQHHKDIHDILGWLCPDYAAVIKCQDRFPEIFAKGHAPFLIT